MFNSRHVQTVGQDSTMADQNGTCTDTLTVQPYREHCACGTDIASYCRISHHEMETRKSPKIYLSCKISDLAVHHNMVCSWRQVT